MWCAVPPWNTDTFRQIRRIGTRRVAATPHPPLRGTLSSRRGLSKRLRHPSASKDPFLLRRRRIRFPRCAVLADERCSPLRLQHPIVGAAIGRSPPCRDKAATVGLSASQWHCSSVGRHDPCRRYRNRPITPTVIARSRPKRRRRGNLPVQSILFLRHGSVDGTRRLPRPNGLAMT